MENLSIFDLMYEEYRIKTPIRLIELFAGYGSQRMALKMLDASFEHWKICEWAMNSIIAYASVHRNELKNYGIDYSKNLTKDEIAESLENYGVSIDYNKPASLSKLKRVKEDKLRLCFNSIIWANNLVDISRVRGKDLVIEDTENFTYLLTYSFPCQDLSLAGKGAGMEKGSGTRSGLLWEVERILSECEIKPQILLMENVTQVHGVGNDIHFKQWQLRLEELGYQSYWDDLSAVDFKIPQTRNRTFMVSILGDYNYKFPKRTKLDLRLKHLLESNVSEKYYLNNKMKKYILNRTPLGDKGNFAGNLIGKECEKSAGTITTKGCSSGTSVRGSDTLIIENMTQDEINEKIYLKPKIVGNYSPSGHNASSIIDSEGVAPTVMENHGTVTAIVEPVVIGGVGEMKSNGGTQFYQQDRIYDGECAISVTTSFNPYYAIDLEKLRIRKLTPRECGRLQGLTDSDINKIMENQTTNSSYHLFGDSICVTVLMRLFSKFFNGCDWLEKFKPTEWWKNE